MLNILMAVVLIAKRGREKNTDGDFLRDTGRGLIPAGSIAAGGFSPKIPTPRPKFFPRAVESIQVMAWVMFFLRSKISTVSSKFFVRTSVLEIKDVSINFKLI